jgi:hypothetical protein
MRVPKEEFLALPLEAHALLREVPLKDVSAIDLPGGGSERTIGDVLKLMSAARKEQPTSVRALVGFRRYLGKVFGWDGEATTPSYASRLSDEQRARSLSPLGSPAGPLSLLYEFPHEMVGEIENATVHAFSCMTLVPTPSGYRFYMAVYVQNTSRWTPVYMAAIEPFRRFLVYPALLSGIRDGWLDLSGVVAQALS